MIEEALSQGLIAREANHLRRQRAMTQSLGKGYVLHKEKRCLSYASNDYLGIANHPDLIAAAIQATEQYGVSSGGSQLITGYSDAHHRLEERLAELTGYPAVMLFSSGYMANLGLLATLSSPDVTVLHDRENHASLLDGSLYARARIQRYRHLDCVHLEEKLARATTEKKLIVTDGVFSMTGDIAPIAQLSKIAKQYQASLVIDDAHGLGMLGASGKGSLAHCNVSPSAVDVLTCSLAKACACYGAFVAGSHTLIEALTQYARTIIYTSALPANLAATTLASLNLLKKETWRREKLYALIASFQQGARQLQLPVPASQTAIQTFLVGDNQNVLALQDALLEQGIYVAAIRPPSVPVGESKLRITLTAHHEPEQIETLLVALTAAWKKINV